MVHLASPHTYFNSRILFCRQEHISMNH
uniref:Uncharacterized protein MANES_03G163400 n=1 Tax=Rhizophora mucronata TaxID=61149 RepID=A0A2P2K2V7_RHIMU